MEKRVLLTELVDRGSHLRKEITPTAVVTDDGKYTAGTFWDANKTLNEIVHGATEAQDTLKEVEDKLNNEIATARNAEQALSDRMDDILGIDALDIADLKSIVEDLDPETGILSVIDNKANTADLGTAATKNVPTTGNASTTEVVMGNDSRLTDARNAADVSAWAKASTKPTYTYSEITNTPDLTLKANVADISVSTIGNANGHDYVDLGLPSGTLWATMNIGATGESGYGNYYMYGKTTAYNMSDSTYTGTENPLSSSADTAHSAWGGDWSMPTQTLFTELINNTDYSWVTIGGKTGGKFTSRTDNTKYVFFPAAGNKSFGTTQNAGKFGYYWSSTPSNSSNSYYTAISSTKATQSTNSRQLGYSVRAVLGSTTVLGKTATDAEKTAWNNKADASVLTDYVQKSQTAGLLKNDGTVDTNTYLTQHQDISGKANASDLNKLKDDISIDFAGHDYVEIGGIKWATMNVGANSVTDTGLYFQWGDTQGYSTEQLGSGEGQKYFSWANYKYGNGTSSPGATGQTKYNSTDGKTVLDESDDAARANWGGSWRMPTTAEYVALGNAVTTAWTADYQGSGVAGIVCTDKTDSSKVLFFPAAGLCYDGSVNEVGDGGLYWSSSLYSSDAQKAYSLYFYSTNTNWGRNKYRYYGYPVRGIYTGPADKVLGTTILDSERTAWNAKANASDVYTKAEIDQMLQQLANNN